MIDCFEIAKNGGAEIIIISDANTFYISSITKAKGIDHFISNTITNPGLIDSVGRLSIARHSTESHNCPNKCALNLCKGKELLEYMAKFGPYDQIIYAGDGQNDFCPSTKLQKTDIVLPRSGKRFSSMLEKEKYSSKISAKVIGWASADDLLEVVRQIFQ
jgi:pyridoxal phosphate phosphatase PHOSPHO2